MSWIDGSDILAKMAVLEAEFHSALLRVDPDGVIARLSQEVTITTKSHTFTWNDLLGTMREWVNDREFADLTNRDQTITPKHRERSIEMDKDDFDDDLLGLCKSNMNELALIVGMDYRYRLIAMLEAGFTEIGWDGKAIYANDHPYTNRAGVAATMDNLTDAALSADALASGLTYFDTLKTQDGADLYVKPDILVCGPSLRSTAEGLLKTRELAGGGDNINYGRVDLLVDPGVSGGHWHLAHTQMFKPLRLVKRKIAEVKFNEPYSRNKVQAGVDARHDAMWRTYQLVYGSTGDA